MRALMLSLAVVAATLAFPSASAQAAPQITRIDTVQAKDTDEWTLRLTAGQAYQIVVLGNGDTDLDAYLYDENDELVASDEDEIDLAILNLTPTSSGTFTLEIVNHGTVENTYRLTVK